jgi:hypothetical protein
MFVDYSCFDDCRQIKKICGLKRQSNRVQNLYFLNNKNETIDECTQSIDRTTFSIDTVIITSKKTPKGRLFSL